MDKRTNRQPRAAYTEIGQLEELPILLDVNTVSRITGLSRRTVVRHCEAGTFESVKVGNVLRINKNWLIGYLGLGR